MNIDYKGKTVVVTGAAGYIGSASARLFAALGATVVAADLPGEGLEALQEDIVREGGAVVPFPGDLTQTERVSELIALAQQQQDGIDVLFNNAGGMLPTPMLDVDVPSFDNIRALNFDAVYHACLAALPQMIERGRGVIINTTSSAGTGAVPGLGVYGAAKAGVNSFTRSIAIEHGRNGIRANAIAPSAASPGLLAYLDTLPGGREAYEAAQPMGRIGTADEVAEVAAYLGSDFARFVNGVVLPVDGGIEALLAMPQ